MLRLVIPKGSLEEQTLALLEAADLRVRRGSSRDYHGRIQDDRIEPWAERHERRGNQAVEAGRVPVEVAQLDPLVHQIVVV